MKRVFNYLAVAASALLVLSACTSDKLEAYSGQPDTNPESPDNAITFGTYTAQSGITRAGYYGSINSNVLQTNATNTGNQGVSDGANGFGVFAYYTGKDTYAQYQKTTYNVSGAISTADHAPNFMYNQQVYYNSSAWTYSPIKYWPNEGVNNTTNKNVDDQDGDNKNNPATTSYENGGYVSFFAYAPYVFLDDAGTGDIDIEAGDVTTGSKKIQQPKSGTANFNGGTDDGIVAVTANSETGDPKIRYKLNNSKTVDLLWGTTNGSNGGKASSGVPYDSQNGVTYNASGNEFEKAIRKGYTVNADLQKMNVGGKVNFLFKHALAKVGGSATGTTIASAADDDPTTPTNGLMVVLDLDKENIYETGGVLEPFGTSDPMYEATRCKYMTKVTIESIEITSSEQVSDAGKTAMTNNTFDFSASAHKESLCGEGVFNLATGKWKTTYDNSGTNTNYSNASIDHKITQSSTDAGSSAVLNDNIKEVAYTSGERNEYFKSTLPLGVTTTPKNVYGNETNPLVFIPGSRPILTISVVYLVRTYDPNLQFKYSEVKQKITKKLALAEDVDLNKQYNLLMHLGLTSVKFTASVADWDVNSNVTGTDPDGVPGSGDEVITYQEDVEHVYLPTNVGLHKMQKFEVTYETTTASKTVNGDKRTDITWGAASPTLSKSNVSGQGGTSTGGTISSVKTTLRDQADDGNKEYSREWEETSYSTSITSSNDNYKYTGYHNIPASISSGAITLEPNYTTTNRTITVTVGYDKASETYNPITIPITITQKAATAPNLTHDDVTVAADATSYTLSGFGLSFTDGTDNYSITNVDSRCTITATATTGDASNSITDLTHSGLILNFAANNSTENDKKATVTVTYTDYEEGTIIKTINITQSKKVSTP